MDKRISALIAMGLVIATGTPSYAFQYKNMGIGVASCGAFIEKPPVKEAAIHWMLGFITAINVTRTVDSPSSPAADMLNGADADSVKVWLNNYCTANPMKNIGEAAIALVIEMNKAGQ